ncbi:MAG: bifunctional (p)ppGpp synthetase/guanosine-3',5'-bis(diphosphate) 3'-pyrophosphohydrolase [Fimbriimonadaceae bacterium]|nr:bifunctional (p)ppGpp synthetase/guanosine-3',5'-bis(diphosphate) 3'-pyrophosphohydrolase [Fimbriimonadaceae bacterium]
MLDPDTCPIDAAVESAYSALAAAYVAIDPTRTAEKIRRAFVFANAAHEDQRREDGSPYIFHPIAVARTIVELNLDEDSVCAALLHDAIEDNEKVTRDQVEAQFGRDVLAIVDGVTKIDFDDRPELSDRQRAAAKTARTAETLRKMLLAMANDMRVMIIKLADRLHNMQTIGNSTPAKQIRVSTETLDVYAPLAARLGIWQLKWQLEDLSFKTLHPKEFAEISRLVGETRAEREDVLAKVIQVIREKCQENGIEVLDIRGRPKHLFSIWNKMVKNKVPFDEIHDLLALRLLVRSKTDCYVALNAVHEAYVMIPALFFDYISRPKPNGYQSLHTKVMGPKGQIVEIQIRTAEMHQVAEFGVAAHWTYKEGTKAGDEQRKLRTLREQLFDWSTDSRTSSDYLRTLATDVFSEQVFVFTPKGDVIDLPADSTPVDFAFRVHTDLGMTLIGARVNGTMVPLSTSLKNGDVVEIINRSNAQPSLDWLEFVKSAHTRAKLRAHFRKLSKSDDAHRGRELADKELRAAGLDPKLYLTEDRLKAIAASLDSVETPQDVLAKVGAGLMTVQSLIGRLRGTTPEPLPPHDRIEVTKTREGKLQLSGQGVDQVLVSRSKCCSPIPGDDVVGYVTRGRGIMVHRRVCPNAMAFQNTEPERLMPYFWEPDGNVYAVPLRIHAMNRQGLLADVSTVFAEAKANVSGLKAQPFPNSTYEILVTIDVRDTEHLNLLLTKIGNLSDIISILRLSNKIGK